MYLDGVTFENADKPIKFCNMFNQNLSTSISFIEYRYLRKYGTMFLNS